MRQIADAARIRTFLHALAKDSRDTARIYLTGGATAVLYGWRPTTKDVDLKMVPETDALLRAIAEMKDRLQINVELASPDQFIPELPGWQDRSPFVETDGRLSFFHYDLYSQALAKLERGHAQDLADVQEMARRELIEPGRLLALFDAIEEKLYRYPAVHPKAFRAAVEEFVRGEPTPNPGGSRR